jgi:hypothetical protein
LAELFSVWRVRAGVGGLFVRQWQFAVGGAGDGGFAGAVVVVGGGGVAGWEPFQALCEVAGRLFGCERPVLLPRHADIASGSAFAMATS